MKIVYYFFGVVNKRCYFTSINRLYRRIFLPFLTSGSVCIWMPGIIWCRHQYLLFIVFTAGRYHIVSFVL